VKQSDVFLQTEGDAFYERNRDKLREPDPVQEVIACLQLPERPSVLEVGCGDGWRLKALRQKYDALCFGIDASAEAIKRCDSSIGNVIVWQGRAGGIVVEDGTGVLFPHSIDLVIYGFVLYVCDREDLFTIAAECDRVLRDGGFVVIHDFCATYPYRRPYKHKEGLFSYHQDYSRLWLGHPAYREIMRKPCDDGVEVIVLHKNVSGAYPLWEEK